MPAAGIPSRTSAARPSSVRRARRVTMAGAALAAVAVRAVAARAGALVRAAAGLGGLREAVPREEEGAQHEDGQAHGRARYHRPPAPFSPG